MTGDKAYDSKVNQTHLDDPGVSCGLVPRRPRSGRPCKSWRERPQIERKFAECKKFPRPTPDLQPGGARPRKPRGSLSRRLKAAKDLAQPALALRMLKRALAQGFPALYLLVDAWFTTPKLCQEVRTLGLHLIGRLKRDKTRFTEKSPGYPGQLLRPRTTVSRLSPTLFLIFSVSSPHHASGVRNLS